MITTTRHTNDWDAYLAAGFEFAEYPPGAQVLDVGFGGGEQMKKLHARGCRAYGIEYDTDLSALSARGAAIGLPVCRAQAERLPFSTASLDGLVCKVVVPYTDEPEAIQGLAVCCGPVPIARVSYHGLGYSLKYLLTERNWKRRVYGARVILNTWIYAIAGTRCFRRPRG